MNRPTDNATTPTPIKQHRPAAPHPAALRQGTPVAGDSHLLVNGTPSTPHIRAEPAAGHAIAAGGHSVRSTYTLDLKRLMAETPESYLRCRAGQGCIAPAFFDGQVCETAMSPVSSRVSHLRPG